jgi:hypothetical protein
MNSTPTCSTRYSNAEPRDTPVCRHSSSPCLSLSLARANSLSLSPLHSRGILPTWIDPEPGNYVSTPPRPPPTSLSRVVDDFEPRRSRGSPRTLSSNDPPFFPPARVRYPTRRQLHRLTTDPPRVEESGTSRERSRRTRRQSLVRRESQGDRTCSVGEQ